MVQDEISAVDLDDVVGEVRGGSSRFWVGVVELGSPLATEF